MEYTAKNREETEKLGEELGKSLSAGAVVALYGPLGAGKTAFIKGLARGLGFFGNVTSPTYTVVNEYQEGEKTLLVHFDMYRLSGSDDLYAVGWDDYLDRGVPVALEWADIVEDALEPGAVRVFIDGSGEEPRRIKISK